MSAESLPTNREIDPTPEARRRAIHRALELVVDPEIPVLSVVDLGIIADVRIDAKGVHVDMTPTFIGCPALEVIRREIADAIRALGEPAVAVKVVYDPPWTSDRITPEGRRKLAAFGIAPPAATCVSRPPAESNPVACPFCGSSDTALDSLFGPTLCRSIHYCRNCRQSFEHMKRVDSTDRPEGARL
jgi:ring-1,2-phenylacetyl-CoA epoxidase subunit PaaD